MRRLRDRRVHRRQLRLVTSRFYLRHRTLSEPLYQFMLQPSITALEGFRVIQGLDIVCSSWISAFAYNAAMDPAPALPFRIGYLRARNGASTSQSRSQYANCN